ncbi:MAG: transglutaminase-like domain-containing protein [Pirellulales bacterium]
MRMSGRVFVAILWLLAAGSARAQFEQAETKTQGVQFGKEITQKYRVGAIVTAGGELCTGIHATTPVPFDWPEQQVRIVDEEISPTVKSVQYRMIGGTAKQMVIEIPHLPAGDEAKALVTFEVTRRPILPPADTSVFVVPKRLDSRVRLYLGPSPSIETQHAAIRNLAKTAGADKEGAWEKVEAIYDLTREKVKYKQGPLKGAAQALRDGDGDCEELSSLFIALCRVNKIPARTVWVPGHCYPEFYLQDAKGTGYWFPCQAAGSRAFGGIPEVRPILQKGDNFRDPDRPRDKQRYVAEFLTGKGGKPQVKFLRELVP